MKTHQNPVIERIVFWGYAIRSKSFNDYLKDKPSTYFHVAIIVAEQDKSIPKQIWFDYVDGLMLIVAFLKNPKQLLTDKEIESLLEPGLNVIIKYLKSPGFQKSVIGKFQFSTDSINIGGLNQTTIDADSLFKFNKAIKEFLIDEDSVKNLRMKFLEKKKEDYGFLEKKSNSKPGKKEITKGIPETEIRSYDQLCWPGANEKIIEYLRKAKMIDSMGTKWIEKSKTQAAQLLKVFYLRSYFSSKPTHEEYKIMLKDTFSFDVGLRTIQGAPEEDDYKLVKKIGPIPNFKIGPIPNFNS